RPWRERSRHALFWQPAYPRPDAGVRLRRSPQADGLRRRPYVLLQGRFPPRIPERRADAVPRCAAGRVKGRDGAIGRISPIAPVVMPNRSGRHRTSAIADVRSIVPISGKTETGSASPEPMTTGAGGVDSGLAWCARAPE